MENPGAGDALEVATDDIYSISRSVDLHAIADDATELTPDHIVAIASAATREVETILPLITKFAANEVVVVGCTDGSSNIAAIELTVH